MELYHQSLTCLQGMQQANVSLEKEELHVIKTDAVTEDIFH